METFAGSWRILQQVHRWKQAFRKVTYVLVGERSLERNETHSGVTKRLNDGLERQRKRTHVRWIQVIGKVNKDNKEDVWLSESIISSCCEALLAIPLRSVSKFFIICRRIDMMNSTLRRKRTQSGDGGVGDNGKKRRTILEPTTTQYCVRDTVWFSESPLRQDSMEGKRFGNNKSSFLAFPLQEKPIQRWKVSLLSIIKASQFQWKHAIID